MSRKLTREDFIKRAREVHGDLYDYSKVNYVNSKDKVCIICKRHGEFWQIPNSHLNGRRCPKCHRSEKLTNEIFVKNAKKVHGNKYDYTKVNYINNNSKVEIICPHHGSFFQTPKAHVHSKNGCAKCSGLERSNTNDFIEKSKKIHGDKYNYDKVTYVNNSTKVKIKCIEHNEYFFQAPNNHLNGSGCPRCSNKNSPSTKEFIENCEKVHGDKYDYSKSIYKGNKENIEIICKSHGSFWQTPNNHISNRAGCPKCKHKNERITGECLENILGYCPNKKTFRINKYGIKRIIVDFYFQYKDKIIIVEYNGSQHYEYNFWKTLYKKADWVTKFRKQQIRDRVLRRYCKDNSIYLIEIDGREYTDEKIYTKVKQELEDIL